MRYDDKLSPEEQAALQRLPRERDPGALVERRIVAALRAEGLVESRAGQGRFRGRFLPAAAAAAALFLGGVVAGQWLSGRQAGETIVALNRDNAEQAAALVQRTGSAYAAAIVALANLPDTAQPHEVAQGREVALSALYAAADALVRLAPDDPVVIRILQAMDRPGEGAQGQAVTRRVVWF